MMGVEKFVILFYRKFALLSKKSGRKGMFVGIDIGSTE